MRNTTEIMEGLDIETKSAYRAAMVETLINGDADTKEKGLVSLRTFILRSLADLIGVAYQDFKLTAISAWENDETHIRHLSCSNFQGPALVKSHYEYGKKTMTHGYPWKPGLCLENIVRSEKGVKSTDWDGQSHVEEVLEWLIDGTLTYYFGVAKGYGAPGIDCSKKEQQRYKILTMLGADYNVAGFLYDTFEDSGCSGFSGQGAVGELQLNLDGSKYVSIYHGAAYVPEPTLIIDSPEHSHLNENVHI